MIHVLLLDNHRLLYPGIHTIFSTTNDVTLLGAAASQEELRQICQEQWPDVVLLSPNVAEPAHIEIFNSLKQHCPTAIVLILLSHPGEVSWSCLANHGTAGAILKSETPDKLIAAVRAAAQGQSWYSPALLPEVIESHLAAPGSELTEREVELLQLVVQEKTDKEIALALNLAERTVRSHLASIYIRLGVKTRVGAAVQAVRLGLVEE